MDTLDTIVDTHLQGYCEPDPARRADLLGRVWHADGELLDPPIAGVGPEEIAALVDVVLGHYPQHRFVRTSTVDAHHDHARYAWDLVAPDGAVAVSGLDVATVVDGRLSRVVGFFGPLVAADSATTSPS
jgi:hypothetical protein